MIVFDIETGHLPLEQIQSVLPPFDRESIPHPGEFDPDSVKLGNLKDPVKIDGKIADAEIAHQHAVAKHSETLDSTEQSYWDDIQERGALSAVTGQVVAIGYSGKKVQLHTATGNVSEQDLLVKFWEIYQSMRSSNRPMVGFNIKGFDVPFLAQRSWATGVEVPPKILTPTGYLDSTFIDLRDRWQCGNRWGGDKGFGTLDTVCRSCGLPTKPSNCTGADFASMLWSDDEVQRQAALDYLRNDLEMTAALADRLGVH